MSSKKHLLLAFIAAAIVFALGFGVLVWPPLRNAAQVTADIQELDHKNRTLEERTELVKQLSEELKTARAKAARTLKRVPNSPEIADLLHQLAVPVDGYLVYDRATSAGRVKEATTDGEVTARAVPVTVDLVARYQAVRDLIERIETSDRLVRVTSVRLRRDTERSNVETEDEAVLIASITLEAIFDPAEAERKP